MISKKQSENIKKFLGREIDPAFARRARIILENLDAKSGMKILEVGCGRGFYEAAIAKIYPEAEIVGVDVNEKYLEVARRSVKSRKVRFLRADGTKLPFKNNEFDRVICSEVLEHIKCDDLVLKEIYRVLKPGGIVLITVPNKNYPFFWDPVNFILERLFKTHIPANIWWLAGIWADHVRLYSEKELVGKVDKAKFKIGKKWRSMSYCLPFSHFILYGVGKNLVELGGGGSFNRFSFESKPSVFVQLVKKVIYMRDQMNEADVGDDKNYLNIIVTAIK